jgi:hypothetical protein
VVTVTRIGTDIATIENTSAAPASTAPVFAPAAVDFGAASVSGAGFAQSTTDLSMLASAIDAGLIPVTNISR